MIDENFSSVLQFYEEKEIFNTNIIKELKIRDSLISYENIPEIESTIHPVVDSFSSDEDSDDENYANLQPNVKDVIENLLDENVIITCV